MIAMDMDISECRQARTALAVLIYLLAFSLPLGWSFSQEVWIWIWIWIVSPSFLRGSIRAVSASRHEQRSFTVVVWFRFRECLQARTAFTWLVCLSLSLSWLVAAF
jgi:hypothetical protein